MDPDLRKFYGSGSATLLLSKFCFIRSISFYTELFHFEAVNAKKLPFDIVSLTPELQLF